MKVVVEDTLSSEDTEDTNPTFHHRNSNNDSIANNHFNCSSTDLNPQSSSQSFSDQSHTVNALPALTIPTGTGQLSAPKNPKGNQVVIAAL